MTSTRGRMCGPVTKQNDAFGQGIWSRFHGGQPYEIVERDDGYIDVAESTARYFAEFKHWPKRQQRAIRFAQGEKALDVGCGAGRVTLFLQERGFSVTAIDNSPLAIRTCRKRGVTDARVLGIEDVHQFPRRRFDTVVMFGNNFGLFGSYRKAKRLLKQLHDITTDDAVILAETLNPHMTDNSAHLRYQRLNQLRGRMPGQIRIRIRFERCVGRWFDYLFVSPAEMADLLKGTAWAVRQTIDGNSPRYVAVIGKV